VHAAALAIVAGSASVGGDGIGCKKGLQAWHKHWAGGSSHLGAGVAVLHMNFTGERWSRSRGAQGKGDGYE
jgi:hypothetical protein